MVIRLVNKSKAECDINLYSGRTVRLKPSSYITLNEKLTEGCKAYYRQLSDLGLYLEMEPVQKKEVENTEVPEENKVSEEKPQVKEDEGENMESLTQSAEESPAEESPAEESPAEESPAEESPAEESPAEESPAEESPAEESPAVTVEDLMKYTKPQLIEMAKSYGATGLESLSKKEISVKIVELSSAGKQG